VFNHKHQQHDHHSVFSRRLVVGCLVMACVVFGAAPTAKFRAKLLQAEASKEQCSRNGFGLSPRLCITLLGMEG
jgi:hypothetical protein